MIRFYFVPYARVGFKEKSPVKIIWGLFFGKADRTKQNTELFMRLLWRNDSDLKILLRVPQSAVSAVVVFIERVFKFFGIKADREYVVAHLELPSLRGRVITVMPMFFQDSFTVSKRGWGTLESLERSMLFASSCSVNVITDRVAAHRTKIVSPVKRLPFDYEGVKVGPGERAILVALQLPWDETVVNKYLNDWVGFIESITTMAEREARFKFVVRVHPLHSPEGDHQKVLSELLKGPNVCLSGLSLYEDFERCEAAVVINSGVGFEALCAGLPVLSFGDSIYRNFTNSMLADECSSVDLDMALELAYQKLCEFRVAKTEFIASNLLMADDLESLKYNPLSRFRDVGKSG